MAALQTEIRTLRGIQQSFVTVGFGAQVSDLEPKGAVFTKSWVVELLLDLAGYLPSNNLIDAVAVEPSFGEGAFLIPMIGRLLDSCERFGRDPSECGDSIAAFELDRQSAAHARDLATTYLLSRGVTPQAANTLTSVWIRTADYLLESIALRADFVIGNPPYIRLEDIPPQTALLYRDAYATMRGRADIYIAFFEAALHQLKTGGVCAFICADRWMRNQYGAELRKLIASKFSVDVVLEMHSADAFQDDVDAYPAITVIRKQMQHSTIVASADSQMKNIPTPTIVSLLFSATKADMPKGLRAACVQSWFEGSDPWPCTSPEQLALLRRLEMDFSPLEASTRIGIGVASGNDRIFITKDAGLVEPSRLLKLALAKDIRGGSVSWSGNYLVDPWNAKGLVQLEHYPLLKSYFEAHRTALQTRHTAVKNLDGWFRTIDRVSHELTARPKLYIADIKERLDPVLDNGETYPHHNLYFIESDTWNLEILGGILISTVGQFFIESYGVRMRGGYLRFQAQYLRRIRVPKPEEITPVDAASLVKAFRERDYQLANDTSIKIYGLNHDEKEILLGHR